MLRHPAHVIALGAGAGLAPVAPGTAGTLLAFPLYWLLATWCTPVLLLGVIAAGFVLGIWACGATGRALGVADHGAMVWDEVIAFALVLVFTPITRPFKSAICLIFCLSEARTISTKSGASSTAATVTTSMPFARRDMAAGKPATAKSAFLLMR